MVKTKLSKGIKGGQGWVSILCGMLRQAPLVRHLLRKQKEVRVCQKGIGERKVPGSGNSKAKGPQWVGEEQGDQRG